MDSYTLLYWYIGSVSVFRLSISVYIGSVQNFSISTPLAKMTSQGNGQVCSYVAMQLRTYYSLMDDHMTVFLFYSTGHALCSYVAMQLQSYVSQLHTVLFILLFV